ncbi:hypothetical protein [Kocuria sp. CPCC 205263]
MSIINFRAQQSPAEPRRRTGSTAPAEARHEGGAVVTGHDRW